MEDGKGEFEGYIYMTFTNACIRRSTDNPNGALLARLRHASSIASNASISPMEEGSDNDIISADYNFVVTDAPDDKYNHNQMFE